MVREQNRSINTKNTNKQERPAFTDLQRKQTPKPPPSATTSRGVRESGRAFPPRFHHPCPACDERDRPQSGCPHKCTPTSRREREMGRKERIAQISSKVRGREPAREPITALPCVPRARQMQPPVFFVGGPPTQRAASGFGTKASPGGVAAAAEQAVVYVCPMGGSGGERLGSFERLAGP